MKHDTSHFVNFQKVFFFLFIKKSRSNRQILTYFLPRINDILFSFEIKEKVGKNQPILPNFSTLHFLFF